MLRCVFFWQRRYVFSYSLFLLFFGVRGMAKALSPTVAAVLFAGGLAAGGNGGLSEIEDWCYDMGVCIGGLISEKDCLAHGGKWTAADGGACYMTGRWLNPILPSSDAGRDGRKTGQSGQRV